MTVAMAEQLARDRADGHLLRDLGAVIVLLELCAEQRDRLGGLQAEVMRTDLAARAGLSVDSLDRCNRALERAGVLRVDRRREGAGGRHLPSTYTVVEAVPGVAAKQERGGRRTGEGWPQTSSGVAANEDRRSRNAATPSTETRPSNAGAGWSEVEERLELPSPQTPLTPPAAADPRGEGGRGACSPEQELCEALLAAWAPALGDSPRRDYAAHRSRWLTAARALRGRHPHQRLADALEYMVTDEILGSQALTMTGFAKVADQLIARAYARRQRGTTRPGRAGAAADGLPWEEAKQALERAVQRHGREGRAAALDELGTRSEQLVRFVELVRWTQLCEQPMRFVERRYTELWAEITRKGNRPEEHAA